MDNNCNTATEEKAQESLDDILRGAKAIGAYIRKKPGATNYLLVRGRLPADKEGAIWISTKSRLREHYGLK